jgi:rare lipoprotein A
MRKALYMFLILGFVTLGSAQSSPNKKGKAPVLKDTISIENPAAVQPEIIFNDTVIAVKGKFRLYKKSAHASYYADKFSGRKTASGKKFSNKKKSNKQMR